MPASRRARQPSTLELLLGRKSSDSGVTELVGVAVLWLGGSVVLLRKSSVFAVLFTWQRGGSSRWQRAALRYPVLVLLHCSSIFLTGCLQQRVTTKWTQNIARKLHRLLFQKQNFHRLHPETKDSIISEADLHVCRDIYDMARATSEVAVALIEALVKTTVFAGSAILHKKWLGGLFPPAAFLLAVKIVLGTHPADHKPVQTSLQHFEARLKQHFFRVQQRSDTILMMQGEAFELDLLQKALRDVSAITRRLYGLMFPVEMTEWLFLHSTQAASLLELAAFAFAMLGSRSPLKSGDGFQQKAHVVGQHLLQVQNFFIVCSAWNAFLSSRTLLMSCAPATSRVKQLYARLDALEHGHHGHPKATAQAAKPKPEELREAETPGGAGHAHTAHAGFGQGLSQELYRRTTAAVKSRWRSASARLWATLQLGLLTSGRRRTILQKVGLMLLLLHARTNLYWRFCQTLSGSLKALLSPKPGAMAKELLLGAVLAVTGGFADQVLRYQAKLATLELWSGAMSHLQRKLLREHTLLRVSQEVSEPMQRLAEIQHLFEGLGSSACEALLAASQLVFLAPLLLRNLHSWSLLFVAHFLLLRLLQCCDAWENHEKSSHSQGNKSLEDQFEALIEADIELPSWGLYRLALTLGDFQQMPSWVLRWLSFKVDSFSGESMDLAETFLLDRMMQNSFIAVQQLSKMVEKFGRLDAQSLRCLELVMAVETTGPTGRLRATATETETETVANAANALPATVTNGVLQFFEEELLDEDGLTLLAHGLRFDLSVKQPLLICGPSGYQQPMLQLLLGMNRSTMMPRQTLMLVSKEPYVPGHCRLLAQLAYPVQLRLPSHAPFTVQVPLLHEHISEVELRQHFARLGASSCQVVVEGGDRKGLVHFSTFEDTIKAVARPQDRVIGGTELQCEIAGESSESPQLHRMRQCLIATQIDHLLTREADGWFARRSWPDVLTRDEQQRLGIARVLYQQPSFCVLEDPMSLELQLHQLLLRHGVTPVALASQPCLGEVYRRQLHVGLPEIADGWRLRP